MKVLQSGTGQKGWAGRYACTGDGNGGGGCGALLLVEQADVFLTYRHSYGENSPERFNTFLCAECNRPTDIETVPFQPREMTAEEKGRVVR